MKMNTIAPKKGPKGVTLIELTVVIAVILVLISVLFVGATYYRSAASRSACIVNLTNMHKAARTVQNITGSVPATLEDTAAQPPVIEPLSGTVITPGVAATTGIVGASSPIAALPVCPDSGTYSLNGAFNAASTNQAAVLCSLAASAQHEPSNTNGW